MIGQSKCLVIQNCFQFLLWIVLLFKVEIECYEYVGYIISTVETTTVQSITSETVTTEGPTTDETTTEETTEETTEQEQTESEEEVTVKPGTPSSA